MNTKLLDHQMQSLPAELLELICGPHRQVVGRIRQVCAAFSQLRGNWDVLFISGGNKFTLDAACKAECSQYEWLNVDRVSCGDFSYETGDDHRITSQKFIVAREYCRMRRGEQMVVVGSSGYRLYTLPYDKYIATLEDLTVRRPMHNTIYFATARADYILAHPELVAQQGEEIWERLYVNVGAAADNGGAATITAADNMFDDSTVAV